MKGYSSFRVSVEFWEPSFNPSRVYDAAWRMIPLIKQVTDDAEVLFLHGDEAQPDSGVLRNSPCHILFIGVLTPANDEFRTVPVVKAIIQRVANDCGLPIANLFTERTSVRGKALK